MITNPAMLHHGHIAFAITQYLKTDSRFKSIMGNLDDEETDDLTNDIAGVIHSTIYTEPKSNDAQYFSRKG